MREEFELRVRTKGRTMKLTAVALAAVVLLLKLRPDVPVSKLRRRQHLHRRVKARRASALLARLDMAEAFKTLAARLPEMRVSLEAAYLPDSGNTGPTHMPVTFLPTPQRVRR